jgi:hypothetical protein
MNTVLPKRNRRPWSITECLQLEREYELLRMPVVDIAEKHQRSVRAILYKIEEEGLGSFNQVCKEQKIKFFF